MWVVGWAEGIRVQGKGSEEDRVDWMPLTLGEYQSFDE